MVKPKRAIFNFKLVTLFSLLGLSSVLNLLDSEYPVVQKLALDTLIRCSSEGTIFSFN